MNEFRSITDSVKQYYRGKALPIDTFIELLEEPPVIRHEFTPDTIKTVRSTLQWYNVIATKFSLVSNMLKKEFFDSDYKITLTENSADKVQYMPASKLYLHGIASNIIGKYHKEQFGENLPAITIDEIPWHDENTNPWHIVTLHNGLKVTVELVVMYLAEYQKQYLYTLTSNKKQYGVIPIEDILSDFVPDSLENVAVVQVVEILCYLYEQQYRYSKLLLPFKGFGQLLSDNIDVIFELYTESKATKVTKLQKLLNHHRRLNASSSTVPPVDENTHYETKETLDEIENDIVLSNLESVFGTPQPLQVSDSMICDDKERQVLNNDGEVTNEQEINSIESLLGHHCKEKISDDKYMVSDSFFLIKEHGQYILKLLTGYKTIGKGDDAYQEEVFKDISKTPFFITARTEHLESGDQGVQIVHLGSNGKPEYTYLTLGEADSKKVKTALRNKGILVVSPKLTADYIDAMYQNEKRQIFRSDNVGWVEHAGQFGFVMPSGYGIGINGLEYSGENPKLMHAIETRGDLQVWLSIFNMLDLEKAHPRIAFLLFSSLLPLFANFHDTFEGFVINITPDYTEGKGSSNGKTTLQQLMLSLQGSVEHWHTNWNKTALGMEEYLYTNVGAYFDDTSKAKMNPQELEDIIYSISDAESRGSTRQKARTRKTVLYSTGEKDFLAHTGKDGVYVRYVDIGIKRNDYGSDNPEETRKIVDHIKASVVSNYGFVYPEAIRFFIKNREGILKKVDAYIEEMAKHGNYENASRIAKRYAMIAVCGEAFILAMRSLTNNKDLYSLLNPFEISLEMFRQHDKKLVDMEKQQEELSQNLLSDLLSKFIEDENHLLSNRKGEVVGFVRKGKEILIRSKVVTENLPHGMTKASFKEKIDSDLVIATGKSATNKLINDGKADRYDIFRRID